MFEIDQSILLDAPHTIELLFDHPHAHVPMILYCHPHINSHARAWISLLNHHTIELFHVSCMLFCDPHHIKDSAVFVMILLIPHNIDHKGACRIFVVTVLLGSPKITFPDTCKGAVGLSSPIPTCP